MTLPCAGRFTAPAPRLRRRSSHPQATSPRSATRKAICRENCLDGSKCSRPSTTTCTRTKRRTASALHKSRSRTSSKSTRQKSICFSRCEINARGNFSRKTGAEPEAPVSAPENPHLLPSFLFRGVRAPAERRGDTLRRQQAAGYRKLFENHLVSALGAVLRTSCPSASGLL